MLALAPLLLLVLASPDSEAIATVRAPTPAVAPAEPAPPSEEQVEEAVGVGEAAPPPAVAAMLAPKPASVRVAPPAAPPPQPAAIQAALPATGTAGELPTGAPEDDYGFVAWCHGALVGHMELYDAVKPELTKLERTKAEAADNAKLDKEQNEAGREYLALYSKALLAAERASPTGIHARGVAADAQGYKVWSAARNAEPSTRMWAWLTWELPARCEIAAKRLEEKSSLFAETFRRGGKDDEPKTADDAKAPPKDVTPKDVAKSDAPAEAAP